MYHVEEDRLFRATMKSFSHWLECFKIDVARPTFSNVIFNANAEAEPVDANYMH